MWLSEKFLGVRLVFVSIFVVLQSTYQINVVLVCGIYFELFSSSMETFTNYSRYFSLAVNDEENIKIDANYDYVLLPHIRAMFFYFLWVTTSLLWFFTNILLFACSFYSKLIGRGAAKHIFIPWIVITITCTAINLVSIPDMFTFAKMNEKPWSFLAPNISLFKTNKPITFAKNDDAIDLIPNIIGYCVAYYLFIAIPLITICVVISIHDCILLWQRPVLSDYAFFIKMPHDMRDDEFNKDSLDEVELERRHLISRSSATSRHSFYSSAVLSRASNSTIGGSVVIGRDSSFTRYHRSTQSNLSIPSLRKPQWKGVFSNTSASPMLPYEARKKEATVENHSDIDLA